MMQIVGTFAKFERVMLRKRKRNGLGAARKQGHVGGRRTKVHITTTEKDHPFLLKSGQKTAADAAKFFNVHSATLS